MQRLISHLGKSQRLSVVNFLKRKPEGMPVKDLAERLDMSYMGAKQICVDLEKGGYVDTFRRHRGVGRPELLYRLTEKARDLFPRTDTSLAISLLNQARKLFGPQAPDKLLFLHFQDKAASYAERVKGDTPEERVKSLARVRDAEGHMAEFQTSPLRIVERNHPSLAVLSEYPNAAGMERELFQKILGRPVRREVAHATAGNYECVFSID